MGFGQPADGQPAVVGREPAVAGWRPAVEDPGLGAVVGREPEVAGRDLAVAAGAPELPRQLSYPQAWTQMVEVCAVELERGSQILEERGCLVEVDGGREYLRGLGQLYLACQLLEAAMMAHVPRTERPPAFRQHLNRCSQAWSSGSRDMQLEGVVAAVAPHIPSHCDLIPVQAADALAEGPRWSELRSAEEPRWEEGLCGITLLPLEELQELHVVPWLDERPCLVLLANLWKHRVNDRPPSLRGW